MEILLNFIKIMILLLEWAIIVYIQEVVQLEFEEIIEFFICIKERKDNINLKKLYLKLNKYI